MAKLDVMRKIRGLLAKEHAAGTTREEVAAAIALANRLLEREGLTRATLEDAAAEPEEDFAVFAEPLDGRRGGRLVSWKARLAMTLAKPRACTIYNDRGALKIVGRPSDAEILRHLYVYCAREIERLARQHCRGEGRVYANQFRLGCVDAIASAIKAEREAERREQRASAAAGSAGALVALETAITRIDGDFARCQIFANAKLRLRPGRSSGGQAHYGARFAGREAGASIYSGARPGVGAGAGRARIG